MGGAADNKMINHKIAAFNNALKPGAIFYVNRLFQWNCTAINHAFAIGGDNRGILWIVLMNFL